MKAEVDGSTLLKGLIGKGYGLSIGKETQIMTKIVSAHYFFNTPSVAVEVVVETGGKSEWVLLPFDEANRLSKTEAP